MEPPPSVAIVIPCRNEEKYIEKCLHSFLDQDYPAEKLNAFVCDGMSDDKTREKVQALAMLHPGIHLLDNVEKTTPQALNLGIKNTDADIIIILGAHAEMAIDYVSECVKVLLEDKSVGCSGGVLENVYENETSRVIGMAMASPFGVGNAHFRTATKSGYVDTVAFGAYRREVFDKIGLFDEELVRNQDDEFNYRVIKAGFNICLSPAIRCKYYVRAAFDKLARQYFQYGYWKVYVNSKHKAVTTSRQLVPMFFVLYLFLAWIPSIFFPLWALLYFAGLFVYTSGALYFALKKSRQLNEVLGITYSFLILHFNYGAGYIKGILHFVLLNRKPGDQSKKLSR